MANEDPDDLLAQLDAWLDKSEILEHVTTQLTDLRFTGRSSNGFVEAVVDGNGQLLDLRVADAALRRDHPEGIGPDTVEAIETARSAAGDEAFERIDQVVRLAPSVPAPAEW